MEHEPIKFPVDELEDGEISSESEDGYTILERPAASKSSEMVIVTESAASTSKMDDISDPDDDFAIENNSTDSSSDSDNGYKNKKKKKPMLRCPVNHIEETKQTAPNKAKYNIWAASLQEETLMKNLEKCDVTKNDMRTRDVESYDYSIKFRMNGVENSLKRRKSSGDESENVTSCNTKRSKISIKRRLVGASGKNRSTYRSDSNSNNSCNSPRIILDLNLTPESTNEEIAREMANKLYEEKDDLILRAVNIVGREILEELFKETQKTESAGGMMIMNGMRRRTPGGVFLFLLKQCDKISRDFQKEIFSEDRKQNCKEKKMQQVLNRNQKVEALKKSLNLPDKDLPVLKTRQQLVMAHLKPETHTNLSNPPPSPVTDCNRENSSDFDSHHLVNMTTPEKPEGAQKDLISYQEDFLNMHCDEMDMF